MSTAKDKFVPPDRVRKKITNYVEIFRGKMWGDTLNYAEISTVKSLFKCFEQQ